MTTENEQYRRITISGPLKVLFVGLLGLIALVTVFLMFVILSGGHDHVSSNFDDILSASYLLLFLLLLWFSKDTKLAIKNNWWLLAAVLPIEFLAEAEGVWFVVGSSLIVARFIIRILILVKISRRLLPRTYALQVITALATTLLISTALFYNVEHELNPEINTYFDSFWWSVVTGTTVGYGDITPVTTNGRIIGIVMMFIGIGVFGFVTGSVASMLSGRAKRLSSKSK